MTFHWGLTEGTNQNQYYGIQGNNAHSEYNAKISITQFELNENWWKIGPDDGCENQFI